MTKLTITVEYTYDDTQTKITKGPIIVTTPTNLPSASILNSILKAVQSLITIDQAFPNKQTNLMVYSLDDFIIFDAIKIIANTKPGTTCSQFQAFNTNWAVVQKINLISLSLRSHQTNISAQDQISQLAQELDLISNQQLQ